MPLNSAAVNGVMWSRERKPQFFTSNLFPIVFDEQWQISGAGVSGGRTLIHPGIEETAYMGHACLTGGTLTKVIDYPVYDHPWIEEFQINNPCITGGDLHVVIAYKSLSAPDEQWKLGGCTLTGGSMQTVVNYVTYNTKPDEAQLGMASITGGTLA